MATKFGLVFDGNAEGANGQPEHVRASIEASLRRLDVETVDLYLLHRVDPDTPIEETVGAMAELVSEGKVRHLGLSEPGAETLRRAPGVHPIAAVESEYSLFARDPEAAVLLACAELGVGFVAYSPLGRGRLTGSLTSRDDLAPDDFRRSIPQFALGNFERNARLAQRVRELADQQGIMAAQLALAWLLDRDERIVPIFGTRRRANLASNVQAAHVNLTAEVLEALDELAPQKAVAGDRWPSQLMDHLDHSDSRLEN